MNDNTNNSVLCNGGRAAALAVCGCMLFAGCENANPFSQADFYAPVATRDSLRTVDAIDLRERSIGVSQSIEEATAALSQGESLPSLIGDVESYGIALDEVRAAALANNLDLEVALFDPQIAETSVDEEEARFEAVFVASARRSRTDAPTASTLSSAQAENDSVDLGVRIPLRTGGTVNVNLPYNRSETNNVFSTLNPAITTDANFSISQPLLRNAGVRPNTFGIRVAKHQRDLTTVLTKLEAIRVLANADRAYWRLYASHKALEVAQQQYEVASDQLARSRRLADVGEGPPLDVIRAEAGVAARLEAIILAQRDVLARQRELKVVMNRDDLPVDSETILRTVTDPSPVSLALNPADLAELATSNRMEMLEQEIRLAIDASTIEFERNQAFPLVTLDYNYRINGLGGTFRDSLDILSDKSFEDWSLGVNVEIPIGNEAAEARINRAILTRVQRLATRQQRELSIRSEVYDVIDRINADWQRILAARQTVILAAAVLQSEQRIFDARDRTSTDVLNAAAQLADAQLAEIRALADYQISQVDLAFATGSLLGSAQVRWDAEVFEAAE